MQTGSTKKVLAVINPISGTSNKEYVPETIGRVIDSSKFDVVIRFTQRPGHATELTKQAIKENFYAVIAIGGDGTVNEVASALINSNTALGIAPCGSGNGLARHLGIPLSIDKALEIINENHIEDLDYCSVNDTPFFCTCGVGFDAKVSEQFAQAGKRGPITYVKKTLSEYFRYRSQEYIIETPGDTTTERAFVIACGNASQYGNDAFITPHASMHDGLIDVTVIHPFTPLDSPLLGLLLFTRHIDQDTNIHSFRTPELTIRRPKADVMHIDGEPMMAQADLHIKCHHKGIKIFTPTTDNEQHSVFHPFERGFWNFINTIKTELDI